MIKTTTQFLPQSKIRAALILFTATSLACASTSRADDATCKLVLDAMAKSILTQSHQYIALKIEGLNGGRPDESETITTGNATYAKVRGKWKQSISPQSMLDQMNETRKDSKSTCHFVRDEAVDSAGASLYAVHTDNAESGPADSMIWLAKTNGLPIRVNLEMKGMHSDIRYVYGAVIAPPVN